MASRNIFSPRIPGTATIFSKKEAKLIWIYVYYKKKYDSMAPTYITNIITQSWTNTKVEEVIDVGVTSATSQSPSLHFYDDVRC